MSFRPLPEQLPALGRRKLLRRSATDTWCSSAVNRNRLSFPAAFRTRCNPSNAFPQLCIWDAVACPVFSLVDRLPSMPSAGEELPPLFGHFAGTTRSCDSLPAFSSGLWLITFPDQPAHTFVSGVGKASQFSREEVPCMSGVFDLAGPVGARDGAPTGVAFRQRDSVGILISEHFAAQYPACTCPCQ